MNPKNNLKIQFFFRSCFHAYCMLLQHVNFRTTVPWKTSCFIFCLKFLAISHNNWLICCCWFCWNKLCKYWQFKLIDGRWGVPHWASEDLDCEQFRNWMGLGDNTAAYIWLYLRLIHVSLHVCSCKLMSTIQTEMVL